MTKDLQAWVLLAMAGAIVAGLTLWRMGLMPHAQAPAVFAPAPALQAEPSRPPPEPRIEYPLESSPPAGPPTGQALRRALADLLGGDAALSFLQLDEFPRRLAATIDNLARPHAPRQVWPVDPAPDRFTVDEAGDAPVIAADNASRYTPFVLMVEAIDARRAVNFYLRLYPSLQRAYEELGFPGHYFNDRVMAVIDLLLSTPETEVPLKLRLTEVKGPIASLRPWVRYEFADPALESLSSGQKIMLRVGPVNERRLKEKLAQIRSELASRIARR
ncbi:MAG: hypothetical protein JWP43_2739 [Ramlibacter sp.]|jgi:hypothetical protein|nr:hypothetical protein [Ramlibacter sp.]